LFGKGIHAVVERGAEAVPMLREALAGNGFSVARAERIAPSLEDVFVSLVEEKDRQEKSLAEVRR
jgi:ABC-2 type transport system ATP-binding protein